MDASGSGPSATCGGVRLRAAVGGIADVLKGLKEMIVTNIDARAITEPNFGNVIAQVIARVD